MTNLIYFEMPILLIFPLLAVIMSAVARAFSGVHILSWICAAVHGLLIGGLLFFGGSLVDIFLMLMLSLMVFGIFDILKNKSEKEDMRDDL